MVAMVCDGIASLEDFETDPIAEVYGLEKKKSYCRAISSTSSVNQVKMTIATKAIAGQRDIEDLRQWKMELQNQHNQVGGNVTPRTEVASNTEHTPVDIHGDNVAGLVLNNNGGSSSKEKKYGLLLLKNLEEVAKGYLASHSTCHQRNVVQDGENIVWVREVIDPETPIFDGPQMTITNFAI